MGVLAETEQALRVGVRDRFLIIRGDEHMIKGWPSGLHSAVWMVRGEKDAVDTDLARYAR
jgi:hypothetical protein